MLINYGAPGTYKTWRSQAAGVATLRDKLQALACFGGIEISLAKALSQPRVTNNPLLFKNAGDSGVFIPQSRRACEVGEARICDLEDLHQTFNSVFGHEHVTFTSGRFAANRFIYEQDRHNPSVFVTLNGAYVSGIFNCYSSNFIQACDQQVRILQAQMNDNPNLLNDEAYQVIGFFSVDFGTYHIGGAVLDLGDQLDAFLFLDIYATYGILEPGIMHVWEGIPYLSHEGFVSVPTIYVTPKEISNPNSISTNVSVSTLTELKRKIASLVAPHLSDINYNPEFDLWTWLTANDSTPISPHCVDQRVLAVHQTTYARDNEIQTNELNDAEAMLQGRQEQQASELVHLDSPAQYAQDLSSAIQTLNDQPQLDGEHSDAAVYAPYLIVLRKASVGAPHVLNTMRDNAEVAAATAQLDQGYRLDDTFYLYHGGLRTEDFVIRDAELVSAKSERRQEFLDTLPSYSGHDLRMALDVARFNMTSEGPTLCTRVAHSAYDTNLLMIVPYLGLYYERLYDFLDIQDFTTLRGCIMSLIALSAARQNAEYDSSLAITSADAITWLEDGALHTYPQSILYTLLSFKGTAFYDSAASLMYFKSNLGLSKQGVSNSFHHALAATEDSCIIANYPYSLTADATPNARLGVLDLDEMEGELCGKLAYIPNIAPIASVIGDSANASGLHWVIEEIPNAFHRALIFSSSRITHRNTYHLISSIMNADLLLSSLLDVNNGRSSGFTQGIEDAIARYLTDITSRLGVGRNALKPHGLDVSFVNGGSQLVIDPPTHTFEHEYQESMRYGLLMSITLPTYDDRREIFARLISHEDDDWEFHVLASLHLTINNDGYLLLEQPVDRNDAEMRDRIDIPHDQTMAAQLLPSHFVDEAQTPPVQILQSIVLQRAEHLESDGGDVRGPREIEGFTIDGFCAIIHALLTTCHLGVVN